ncbi:MAG: hypothetical protein PVG99_08615 [Desulfobacteraceae bacterium]
MLTSRTYSVYKPDITILKPLRLSPTHRRNRIDSPGKSAGASRQRMDVNLKLQGRIARVRLESYTLISSGERLILATSKVKRIDKFTRKRVSWDMSKSPGVAGYKLYWAIGQKVNYNSDSAEIGNVTEAMLPDDVPSFPLASGDIEIGVTAVTYTGNESDMSVISTFFDFTVPESPANLKVESI